MKFPMNSVTPPRATRRDWTGLAVIALPCLLYSMDLTVVNLAVPSLSADLKPSSSQLLYGRHRGVDFQLLGRAPRSVPCSAGSCWNTFGGARCSWWVYR
jgi:hypothetical protein